MGSVNVSVAFEIRNEYEHALFSGEL